MEVTEHMQILHGFSLFILGLALGVWIGIAIYWMPLRQLRNELNALNNLIFKRINQGDQVAIKGGARLRPFADKNADRELSREMALTVWRDEGIGWHFSGGAWSRMRIVIVFGVDGESDMELYRVGHKDFL